MSEEQDPIKVKLLALKESIENEIEEKRAALEKEMTDKLIAGMKEIMGDTKYRHCYGGIEEVAGMFVSNTIIERAIWADHSGDWDGRVRAEDLEEYNDPDAEPDEDEEDEQ
jgi:hypothetical protein